MSCYIPSPSLPPHLTFVLLFPSFKASLHSLCSSLLPFLLPHSTTHFLFFFSPHLLSPSLLSLSSSSPISYHIIDFLPSACFLPFFIPVCLSFLIPPSSIPIPSSLCHSSRTLSLSFTFSLSCSFTSHLFPPALNLSTCTCSAECIFVFCFEK